MRRAARPVLYVGVLGVVLAFGVVHASLVGHYPFTGTSRFGWTIAYAAILGVAAYGFGLPDLHRARSRIVSASVGAAVVGAVAISAVQLVVGDALLPRFVVFGSALVLPDWFRLCARMANGGRSRAEQRDRVAVVGTPDEVDALVGELEQAPERPAAVVAALDLVTMTPTADHARPLVDEVLAARATVLVLDRAAQADPAVVAQAAELHEAGVRIRTLSLFYEQWLGKLPMSELERLSLLFDIGEVHRAPYARVKRIADVVVALVGLVVLVVVTPLVVLGDRLANRGPLLYRQERVGKGGSPFTMLKFRSMRPGGAGSAWTAVDDDRITRFGHLLRRSHLDELPQVVNVLRGDLAIVGPRPEQPAYVSELVEKLPFYRLRHVVRPGLTGWAQVKYGYAGDERDALEKLQYDFWYLRHQSLALDLRITGRTVRAVLGSEGAGR